VLFAGPFLFFLLVAVMKESGRVDCGIVRGGCEVIVCVVCVLCVC